MEDAHGNALLQLQVIHRHGARSPVYNGPFPAICGGSAYSPFMRFAAAPTTDAVDVPEVSADAGAGCYRGQLTPLGAAQMFVLGARLRDRYAAFLPDVYDPARIVARSTQMRRTIESVTACLSGMYPGVEKGRALEIEVRDRAVETMLGNRKECKRLRDIANNSLKENKVPAALRDAVQAALLASHRTGPSPSNASGSGRVPADGSGVILLRDIALSVKANGIAMIPEEKEADRVAVSHINRMYSRETWRLGIGMFVDELLREAENHEHNSWLCKIYSAHDTTLMPVLGCFENENIRGVPDFAADLVLETWKHPKKVEQEPLLKLRYEGEEVQIAGCEQYGTLCPLSVVRAAVSQHIPTDLPGECASTAAPTEAGHHGSDDGTSF